MKRLHFKIAAIALLFILSSLIADAKDIQKTYTWKYNVSKDGSVSMENYDCNIIVHTWDKGETELKLTIDAETRTDEDAAVLDKFLQNLKFSNSQASVAFSDRFWVSRTTIMNRSTMKLAGGETVSLISMELSGELWIPAACRFSLNSKYSQVNMDDFAGSLILNLYNDDFYGKSLSTPVELNDKYSTIEFGDIKGLRADIYNTKFNAGNSGDVSFESKYSRVTMVSCGKLTANSYNDKFNIPKTGDISFTAKYTDLKTESSGNAELDMYNGTAVMTKIKDVKLTSKYCEYQIADAGICNILSSYNDKLTFSTLNSISIAESKYTVYTIEFLSKSVDEKDGYNDKFTVSGTGKDFGRLALNGKYISSSVRLPGNTNYRFKADVKYADFDIDESSFKPVVKIIEGSNVKYDAIKGTESEKMPVIEVNGYQISLKILEK